MKRMILGFLVVMLGLVFMGCKYIPIDPPETAVAFSGLTANGTSGTVTTTALTLTFDVEPTSLAAHNITVTGATKGALTGTGTSRSLAISAITVANGENVTVAIANPAGFSITPASRDVAVNVAATAVVFFTLTANGTSNTVTTTELTIAFDIDPASLTAADITVIGATKGVLTGTGTSRTLAISAISVTNDEYVTVAITNPPGFTITPTSRDVVVYKDTRIAVAFLGLSANGTSGTVTTTELALTFDIEPTGLAAGDITVTGATKGALTGTGTSRTLAISAIKVANGVNVTVTLANPVGFKITPASRDVAIALDTTDRVSANIGMLRYVPSGTFQRDATATNTSYVSAFRMSQYEITRAQFAALLVTDPSDTTSSSGTGDPVQGTNWYHAIAFCNKLSIAEGFTPVYSVSGVNFTTLTYADIPTTSNATWDAAVATWTNTGYRLPTEMEWMWAAMGATAGTTGYSKAFAGSTGSNAIGDYAWYDVNSASTTHPAGTKLPNELGLYDISGNVWEWCWDWDAVYPTGAQTDYRGAASGTIRVLRGGSWFNIAAFCYVASRLLYIPEFAFICIGFRVVRP